MFWQANYSSVSKKKLRLSHSRIRFVCMVSSMFVLVNESKGKIRIVAFELISEPKNNAPAHILIETSRSLSQTLLIDLDVMFEGKALGDGCY